jgi:outer membrane receptor protein involved in Fe transport
MHKFSINLILFYLFFSSPFAIVQDSDGLEEIIVTAQRQEQSLQDVPLAVSSFSGDDLLEQQIEGINDMQLFVPGLRFGGNIGEGGGDIEIRGMVNGAVSGTADSAVGVHINDLAVGITPLDPGQLFDMERVEIIRGPAGTLYGRNAIGGSLNMITAKADPTSFSGKVSVDLGDYGRFGTTSVINIPLDDNAAFRFASTTLKQDGLVDNIYSKGLDYNLDNRNQMGYRATLSFEPSEKTTIHIVHQAQIEDSKRTLTSGTWCDRDPSAVFGCTMQAPENQKFEIAHPMSTLVEQLLIAQGVLNYTPITSLAGAPQELWTMNVRNEPSYTVDEYITQFIVEHDINDDLSLSVAASRKDRKFYRIEAYESPELDTLRFNDTLVTPGGLGTMSASIDSNCSVEGYTAGFYGGCILDTVNYPTGAFNWSSVADTDAVEMKIVSSFDGPHNFLFGMNYFKNYQDTDTDVVASGLDALTVSPPAAMIGVQAASLGAQLYAPFF